jgi:hypothetical protein
MINFLFKLNIGKNIVIISKRVVKKESLLLLKPNGSLQIISDYEFIIIQIKY